MRGRSSILVTGFAVLVASLGGCGASDGNTTCISGATQQCVGPGACKGGQACLPDGSGFGACDCGVPTESDAGASGNRDVAGAGSVEGGTAGEGGSAAEGGASDIGGSAAKGGASDRGGSGGAGTGGGTMTGEGGLAGANEAGAAGQGSCVCGGQIDASSGAIRNCGSCATGFTCGGGLQPAECGCTSLSCAERGMDCGTIDDGCGHALDCGGACSAGLLCGARRTPNKCGSEECSANGWCWVQNNDLGPTLDVVDDRPWANSPNDIWYAQYASGSLMHFNGSTWSLHDLRPFAPGLAQSDEFHAVDVWGLGPKRMYAIALFGPARLPLGTDLMTYDGETGSVVAQLDTPAYSIWGTSPQDIWVAGVDAVHFDGVSTRHYPLPEQSGKLWGLDSNHVYSLGATTVAEFDGSAWNTIDTKIPKAFGRSFVDVHGSGPDDVWVVANSPAVASHWDGSTWTVIDLSALASDLSAVWSFAPNDAIFSGSQATLHWDGSSVHPSSTSFSAGVPTVMFGADGELLGMSSQAPLSHWTGARWITDAVNTYSDSGGHIWGASSTSLWSSGTGVSHFDGANWSPIQGGIGAVAVGKPIWGLSDDDLWVTTGTSLGHWKDGQLINLDGQPPAAATRALWGTSESDVWAVGSTIAHLDASASWSVFTGGSIPAPLVLNDVWGTSPANVWAVGADRDPNSGLMNKNSIPRILHYDGTWTNISVPGTTDSAIGTLLRIRGISADDFWIVGGYDSRLSSLPTGFALHYIAAAGTFARFDTPLGSTYYDLWPVAANNVWFVGLGGKFDNWDGSQIQHSQPFTDGAVRGIWGASNGELWAVGDNGAVFHHAP